ncbi:MAG: M14 family metallopeptidase [Gemmatimonadaceae bacterium]
MPTTPARRLPLAILVAAAVIATGCSRPATGTGAAPPPAPVDTPAATPAPARAAGPACCLEAGLEVAERHRAPAITTRRFTHDRLWAVLDPIVASPALRVAEIGRSIQGRPIRAVTFGGGPTTVLLWSQMHGDESTATMALADILGWLADADPAVAQRQIRDRIAERLTVVMVPMLNPDGAELFQRQNAVGVDVNRDADRLATPEARALKALRDSLRPAFGYNLHDQNARTLAGDDGQQVAIALLAPALDSQGSFSGARANARLVASGIAEVLARAIPGRVARYDDSFNPRAFGDLMQKWGTSTVLIESGALPDDPEKQRLRTMNVVAILSSLDAMATGRYATADPRIYDALPMNARSAVDVLVVGASVMLPGYPEPLRVDLSLNFDEPVARLHPRLREVGDLRGVVALDTIDAPGLFLHPEPSMLTDRGGRKWMRINAPAAFTLRRGREATSAVVRSFGGDPAPDDR